MADRSKMTSPLERLKEMEAVAMPGPWEWQQERGPFGSVRKPSPEAAHVAASVHRNSGPFIAA
jgi:hypothetical protein